MAKKKPGGKAPKGRGRPKAPKDLDSIGPIWPMMEAMMGQLTGSAPDDDTPEGRAQVLLMRAYQAESDAQAVKLAREAIAVWPDCADAYVLMAENARNAREASAQYSQGVAAAERAIGPAMFVDAVGHFWLVLETRPYMRARLGLAQTLWVTGRRDEAVGHVQEMLRLNPNDNQGVRYVLGPWLLELGRDDQLAALLRQYEDGGSALWAFMKALRAFRLEGKTTEAGKLLTAAKKANKFVMEYFQGDTMLPPQRPGVIGRGDRNEAIDCAAALLPAWKATPGAVAWLRGAGKRPQAKKAKGPSALGPVAEVKQRLQAVESRAGEVWQADVRRLPVWLNSGRDRVRPWLLLITNRTDNLVLGQEIREEFPSAEYVWDKLAQAIEAPSIDDPHRPSELQVLESETWTALRPHLEEIGIVCEPVEELDHLDFVIGQLLEHLCGPRALQGLLDMPGIGPEQVGQFYQAAADFYRRAPWRLIAGEETIKIECDRFESGPWYAVVFGQMGMTFGLALYEDLDALTRMREGNLSDEENARLTVALSVTYGDETEVAVPDLDAAETYGWDVAGPDAYPAPLRKERGMVMRLPLAWELALLEACLRVLPDFVAKHEHADPTPETARVPTAAGELSLGLSWVVD